MKDKKKEKKGNARKLMGAAYQAGLEVGAQGFLDHYDKYRRFSGWFFVMLMCISIFFRRDDLTLISFGFMHLTILFNQLWWKLIHIEERQLNQDDKVEMQDM